MTNTTRTIADIEINIACIAEGIAKIEADSAKLREALDNGPSRFYVAGFKFGLFLTPSGVLGDVRHAKLFPTWQAAKNATVRNGAGTPSIPMSEDGAIDLALRLNAETLAVLNDGLHALYEERNDWEDMERAADERYDLAERLKDAACAGDWDLHARLWEERCAAAVEAEEAALERAMDEARYMDDKADEASYYDAFEHHHAEI